MDIKKKKLTAEDRKKIDNAKLVIKEIYDYDSKSMKKNNLIDSMLQDVYTLKDVDDNYKIQGIKLSDWVHMQKGQWLRQLDQEVSGYVVQRCSLSCFASTNSESIPEISDFDKAIDIKIALFGDCLDRKGIFKDKAIDLYVDELCMILYFFGCSNMGEATVAYGTKVIFRKLVESVESGRTVSQDKN